MSSVCDFQSALLLKGADTRALRCGSIRQRAGSKCARSQASDKTDEYAGRALKRSRSLSPTQEGGSSNLDNLLLCIAGFSPEERLWTLDRYGQTKAPQRSGAFFRIQWSKSV